MQYTMGKVLMYFKTACIWYEPSPAMLSCLPALSDFSQVLGDITCLSLCVGTAAVSGQWMRPWGLGINYGRALEHSSDHRGSSSGKKYVDFIWMFQKLLLFKAY